MSLPSWKNWVAAMRKSILNFGLHRSSGGHVNVAALITALTSLASITDSAVYASDTEPTLTAELDRPLRAREIEELCERFDQDCVAQIANGEGRLIGPRAEEWGEFNPEYFLTLDGKRLSETMETA